MPKSYMDFVNEITSEILYHGLLGHGLFSEKLPRYLLPFRFLTIVDQMGLHRKMAGGNIYILKPCVISIFQDS
jgi:hypothetical protein